jgi:succinylglutamate desuccinylase
MQNELTFLFALPDGFCDFDATDILEYFSTPTLIKLDGQKSPPVFVSILLHGNEFSGLKTMQAYLRKYADNLPRSLYLFVGNVEAASAGKRVLPHQTDYNRCWPGSTLSSRYETNLMQSVINQITQEPLFAAIDLHNNTGENPHYAGMSQVNSQNQYLAALFHHMALVIKWPRGLSIMAFDNICPSVVLECAKPGNEHGIKQALELVETVMQLDQFPQKSAPQKNLQLLKTLATLNIAEQHSFNFNPSIVKDINFVENFDRWNFTEVSLDQAIAETRVSQPLIATDQLGNDITDKIIIVKDGKVYLKQTCTPAMISMDEAIVLQDCLCHLLIDN